MPTHAHSPSARRTLVAGFTLAEMAVVVVVTGILLTAGLRMMQATQNNAARSITQQRQERIKQVLIGYLRTNGRLPCPDAALPPTGLEPATCLGNAGRGVLPWQTLGLSISDVQDGWSNMFTYLVANQTPATSSNWTTKLGVGAFTITELTAPLTAFSVQVRDDQGTLGQPILPNPVAVILSHGKNGLGARTVRGVALLPAPPAGSDESNNAGAASTNFVIRAPTEAAAALGGAYDDIVAYLTPNDLLQPLIDDKTLKGVASSYLELAMTQVALASCTPPTAAAGQPLADAIGPSIGNGVITYICGAGDLCFTGTAMHSATTLGTAVLYRLSLFGAAAQTVTYAQLQAAYPAIQTRCP